MDVNWVLCILDYINSHSGNFLYARSGISKNSLDLLVSAEEEYIQLLETDALPLCKEWCGHFEVRDIMHEARDGQRYHPQDRNAYFLADYLDSHN